MKLKTVVIENNSKTTVVLNLFKSKRNISIDSQESRIENMYPEEIESCKQSIKAFMLEELVIIREIEENQQIEITIDANNIKYETETKPKMDVEIEGE